jgi:predicted ribosomally synthesized peptide with SipW-like signal peptide
MRWKPEAVFGNSASFFNPQEGFALFPRSALAGVSRKLLLSIAAIGAAAAIAGLGTYATFTSSTSASQSVASGTVTIALGATGASTNRVTVGASNIAAGDTIQRSVDLINSGSLNLASVTLTTSATTSSLLNTDTTNGLQMVIDKCSVAWTEGGTAPAYTYTCSGTTSTVLASAPVVGSNLALSNLTVLTAGVTDHLRVTLTLPSAAGNTLQNQSSVIQYTLTGTQRAATNQ